MNRKRLMQIAGPLAVAAVLSVAPAYATMAGSKHAETCTKVNGAIAGGKSTAEVAKEMKLSQKTVAHCQQKVASASNPSSTTHKAH